MTNFTKTILAASLLTIPAARSSADTVKDAKLTKSGPIAAADLKWQPLIPQMGDKGPQIQVVFGDVKTGPVGLLLKLPGGFTSGPHTHSSDYSGVVISGELQDFAPGAGAKAEKLTAGQRWQEQGNNPHDNICASKTECVEFVYFPKGFDFKPIAPAKK